MDSKYFMAQECLDPAPVNLWYKPWDNVLPDFFDHVFDFNTMTLDLDAIVTHFLELFKAIPVYCNRLTTMVICSSMQTVKSWYHLLKEHENSSDENPKNREWEREEQGTWMYWYNWILNMITYDDSESKLTFL
jgi:hypothetical protein